MTSLGVIEALLATNFVWHSEGVGVFGSECAGAEIGDYSGIDAARESEDDFIHSAPFRDFGFKKLNQPIRDLFGVDAERGLHQVRPVLRLG